MEVEKDENNQCNQQTFIQITQFMEVAQAMTTIPIKNDDQYIWISMQAIVFFEIFVCEN